MTTDIPLRSMTEREFACWQQGFTSGDACGEQRGYALGRADAVEHIEATLLHAEAHRIVQAMARLEPWELTQANRRRRERERAAKWRSSERGWPDERG